MEEEEKVDFIIFYLENGRLSILSWMFGCNYILMMVKYDAKLILQTQQPQPE